MWSGYYWGMTMFWWIFWVLAIALFFFIVIPRQRTRIESPVDSAIETLRNRYAAGEIDETEFRRREEVLLHRTLPPASSSQQQAAV